MTLISRPGPDPLAVPAAYLAAAKVKLKRDREAYEAFRGIDQQQFEQALERRVTAAVEMWVEEVRLFGEDVETLEPEAEAALTVHRTAEDHLREASEYARQNRAAYELIRGKGPAAAETEALRGADAADETVFQAEKAVAQAEAELREADQALAEVREGLAGAEKKLDEARQQAAVPAGTAPVSDVTMRACAGYMQCDAVWNDLSERDRFRVRQAAEPRDMMSEAEFQLALRQMFAGGV
jgi:hypothetical protein